MNLEEIFKGYDVNFNALKEYGFVKEKNTYKYFENIMTNSFKVEILITDEGVVKGKIWDLQTNEEYINYKIKDFTGPFVSQIRSAYKNILLDIRNKCFKAKYYENEQANRIVDLIRERYNDNPCFEWDKFPKYAVFKNSTNKKWYGIIMNIDKSKLDEKTNGQIEIINVKLNPDEIEMLLKKKGFYKAYHMNKKYWITIVLDDTIEDEVLLDLIHKSYLNTQTK